MKKIIFALAVVLSAVGSAYAADSFATKWADGVVGTSGTAYRVKKVVLTCPPSANNTAARNCFGQLWNGTTNAYNPASNVPYIQIAATVTQPTVLDYSDVNRLNESRQGTGILFPQGVYWDEVTGETSVTIIYEPKNKF